MFYIYWQHRWFYFGNTRWYSLILAYTTSIVYLRKEKYFLEFLFLKSVTIHARKRFVKFSSLHFHRHSSVECMYLNSMDIKFLQWEKEILYFRLRCIQNFFFAMKTVSKKISDVSQGGKMIIKEVAVKNSRSRKNEKHYVLAKVKC